MNGPFRRTRVLVLSWLTVLPLYAATLWQEEYRDAPGLGSRSRCVEEGGSTFLRVAPGPTPAYVYRDPIVIPLACRSHVAFSCAARFSAPNQPLQLLLTGTGEGDASVLVQVGLTVGASSVQVFTPAGDGPAAPLAAVFGTGRWERFTVRLQGEALVLEQDIAGQTHELWQIAMPGGLYSIALRSAGALDLRDLALRALPVSPTPPKVDAYGLRHAAAPYDQSTPVLPGHTCTTWIQVGPAGLKLTLGGAKGTDQVLDLRLFDESLTDRDYFSPEKNATKTRVLPRAGIEVGGLNQVRLYVRPNLARYTGPQRHRVISRWRSLPAPDAHRFPIVFHAGDADVEIWLDGRYAGRLPLPGGLRALSVAVPVGSAASLSEVTPTPDRSRFLPLEIARMDRPGALAGADVRYDAVAEPPFAALGPANAWLGLVQETSTPTGLVEDAFLSRSAFDGLPEACHFSVPSAQYIRAWLLCTVDDDPAQDPVLTARLTRYARAGRGDAIADSAIELPRGGAAAVDPRIRRVGTVRAGGKERPLWRVELELQSGDIEDLIFRDRNAVLNIGPYLDFELLGRLDTVRKKPYRDVRFKPLASSTSAVHVFAVTLEKTPVELEVRPAQPGNIFHGEETPELPIALRPQTDGEFVLAWTIRDVAGAPAAQGERRLRLSQRVGEVTERLPLRQALYGWYGIDVALRDATGRALLSHNAAFALLPPDSRRSGLDSPYGSWWFSAHYGTSDPALAGPLMLKAGLRKSNHGVTNPDNTEAALAPWKLTAYNVNWIGHRHDPTNEAKNEEFIRGFLERFPSVRTILIFHESRWPAEEAPELLGKPPRAEPDSLRREEMETRWRQANAVAKVVRGKFPDLQIVLGNTLTSSELPAELFRRGLPADYVDYLGYEAQASLCLPERLNPRNVQGAWLLREIGRRMGYERPLSCCFEGVYRTERMLGPQRLAEWYVRDGLLMHAYGFRELSIALLYDVGNCYWSTMWGSSGLCRRNPQFYPRPAYVALATMTRVLDQAGPPKQVPTGSDSVYALEFARRDGKVAYVLWTSRGEAEVTLQFPEPGQMDVLDLYGRGGPRAGLQLALTVDTAPQYVLAERPGATCSVGRRRYPDDVPPAGVRVVADLSAVEAWELAPGTDARLERLDAVSMPYRTRGSFALRAVEDPEQGPCLELELLPRGDLPDLVNEYAVVRLKTPMLVPGEPASLGMLVKGNSGWGRVMWEIEDAQGSRFLSTSNYDGDVYDPPGTVSLNFDGWNFLRFPLTDRSSCDRILVDSLATQWVVNDNQGTGTAKLAYPVKLTGFAVEVPRRILALTEMKPITQNVRFKGLSVFD